MLQVVEINAIDHLESIRLRWTSLFYDTRNSSFFHTLDWLKVYWQHASPDERLRVFLVHRGGEILGILPLVQRVEIVRGRARETLRYPTTHLAEPSGPVGPNPTLTLRTVLQHLADRPWDWQRLVLSSIGEHDHGRTPNAMQLAGLTPQATSEVTSHRIDLDKRDSDARQPQPSQTFERLRPQAYNAHELDLGEAALAECLDLSSNDYVRHAAHTAMHLGMLDLCLLRPCGVLTAFSLNTCLDGRVRQLATYDAGDDSLVELTNDMLTDSAHRSDRSILFCNAATQSALSVGASPVDSMAWEYQATATLKDRLFGALSAGRY